MGVRIVQHLRVWSRTPCCEDILWPHSTECRDVGEPEFFESGIRVHLCRPNTGRRVIRGYAVFSRHIWLDSSSLYSSTGPFSFSSALKVQN